MVLFVYFASMDGPALQDMHVRSAKGWGGGGGGGFCPEGLGVAGQGVKAEVWAPGGEQGWEGGDTHVTCPSLQLPCCTLVNVFQA